MNVRFMEEAVSRFNGALEGLHAAVEQRRANQDQLAGLEGDLHLMALDRAQLARRLDEALARAEEAEKLTADLGVRLDAAIAEIDTLITYAEAA
jgi:hypothetical protein